jgi:putative transcriptional regulator
MALVRLAGRLLLATPGLVDPSFSRTVVLVLAHTDEGALGVVLNRPGGLEVGEVLPDWAHLAAAPGAVFIGGPVQPDTVLCLGQTADGWRTVDVSEDPSTTDVSSIRLFAAYAGWSAEQLEAEIEAGGWYVVDSMAGDPFTSAPDELWRRILRRQGGRVALASTSPDDPSLN